MIRPRPRTWPPPWNPPRRCGSSALTEAGWPGWPRGGFDDVYDNFYPQASSQWDSLAHIGYAPDQMYNGVTESEVLAGTRNTIDHWPPIAPLTACTRCSWSAGR